MNKLEETLRKDNGLYSCYSVQDKEGKFSPVCSIEKSVEITTDVAVKFAEWLSRGFDIGYDNGNHFYMDGEGNELNTQELFEIFINNHYVHTA